MNRCPITYEECGDEKYSIRGLHLLSPHLQSLNDLPYTAQEQLAEAAARASKMSIQGVQPKLSSRLDPRSAVFNFVDMGGTFILKPPLPHYPQVPENEDVTMRMAEAADIEAPLHGMIYAKDGTRTYFIKRFDRAGRHKLPVEDFSQLSGHTRETKYDSSMERVASIVEQFCTFPAVEKVQLFRRVLFNFLVGNEDMHLKNFSVITRKDIVRLAPAYDLLNTSILTKTTEEIALPVRGKKSRLKRSDLVEYYGLERLRLQANVVRDEIERMRKASLLWDDLMARCFLTTDLKERYRALVAQRLGRLEA